MKTVTVTVTKKGKLERETVLRMVLEELKGDTSEAARRARTRIHSLIADIRETEKKAKERAKRQTRRR